MSPYLERLSTLLDDEPAITAVLGRRTASLAVAEPARAVVLAALVRRTGRLPLVVAVPTGAEAAELAVVVGEAVDAVEAILTEGVDATMGRFNAGP